jgi:hypothetical protein
MAQGRSARDYLNAPVDTWLTTPNSVYSTSVTPEDGIDISSRIRTNVFSQTICCRNASTGGSDLSNNGLSDLGAMWQINLFGGPALRR